MDLYLGEDQDSLVAKLIDISLVQDRHPVSFLVGCGNLHANTNRRSFFWLLAHYRLSTHNILRRNTMHLQSYNCVMCDEAVKETVNHLFLHCELARSCWNLVGLNIP
jgi:hypothetical protein